MLVNLKEILAIAEERKCAVGAFNTPNLECLIAVIDAAEKLGTPVIISHAELHENISPLEKIGPVMVQAAEKAGVPVCVQLDHGETLDYIERSLEIGFTGIMYDGSLLPYEENLMNTKKAVAMARSFNAGVEAELGAMPSRKIVDEAADETGAYDRIRARRKILMKEFLSEHSYDLKPGVKAFLEKIRELPVRKVIVTSSTPEEKMPALESLGIGQYFDSFVSVKEVKRGKPFPDVYLFACRKLGLDPGECLAIEDSPNGVRSAYSAGVKVVMVPDLTGPTDELRRMCRVADRIERVMEYI